MHRREPFHLLAPEFEPAADIRDRIRTIHEEFDLEASAGEGVAPEPDAEF